MTKKPKQPQPTEQEFALQRSQAIALADANVKTNATLKTILSGQQGTRLFRGSPLLRQGPSDTAAVDVNPTQDLFAAADNPTDYTNPVTRSRLRSMIELRRGSGGFSKVVDQALANFDAKYGTNPK